MDGNTDETLQFACPELGTFMSEYTFVDGVCKEVTTELSFTDLNANFNFDEGIDELLVNDVQEMEVDNDVCCKRAPKGDLDLLAACNGVGERIDGKHVYYER